ncbi:MAG: hypothetical protein KF914_11965 [Rhizobiaceae bacterium]|nr:hypothetical protein [Rhizobiaceae bacterium]
MSKSPATHQSEKTTTIGIAVRQEVDRALGPTNLPEKQRQEVAVQLSKIVDRYSSPYPEVGYLEQIEKLSPGSTAKIIDATIKHLEHCHLNDMRDLDVKEKEIALVESVSVVDARSSLHGRILGFSAYVILILFSGVAYYMGASTLSYAAFGASVLGVIGQLITGSKSSIKIVQENGEGLDGKGVSAK